MRRRLAASALAAGLAAAAMAAPETAAAQSLQDKIAQCAACHGEDGQSKDPKIPNIGGQPKLFVMYQLFFYREGRRKNPEMNTIAKELTDAELDAISAYVSKLPPSPARAAPDEARYQRGAKLAQERICASCHNPDYSGREQMASLAGQHPEYTLKALQDFRAGIRIGTQAAMPETVRGLDDEALADLAHYLAHFKP
jgi:cytochrome c553